MSRRVWFDLARPRIRATSSSNTPPAIFSPLWVAGSTRWGYALYVFPQRKKKKCTPARREKKSRSSVFFFRRLGRTAAERRPTKSSAQKISCARGLFSSVADNVCKTGFLFRPSLGNTLSLNSLDVAAGDCQFLPSVTENVCRKRIFFRP